MVSPLRSGGGWMEIEEVKDCWRREGGMEEPL